MIKYLFILFNSFILFICSFFNGDTGVGLSGNFPTSMQAGQDVEIEIKINRGDVTGFGALELTLPEGLSLKENSEKTAIFNISAGVAKWEWNELPESEEIYVKFVLNAWFNVSGSKMIQAKFHYVANDEKKFSEMPPAEIIIQAAPTLSTDKIETAPPDTTTKSRGINAEPALNLEVVRTISKGEHANEYVVTIKINKSTTKGFARYSDDVAGDCIEKAVKTDGSSFSIADGKTRFVWVNVPEKQNLEISYLISCAKAHTLVIGGEYSYVEDNQSKRVILSKDTLVFADLPGKTDEIAKTETPKETPKEPEKTKGPGLIQKIKSKLSGKSIQNEAEANFRVQIGAFSNAAVTAEKLKRKFSVKENIKTENLDGLSKFMIGSYELYKAARESRDVIISQNGIKSAFVVAYNKGARITVQEGLMITNQKWFK